MSTNSCHLRGLHGSTGGTYGSFSRGCLIFKARFEAVHPSTPLGVTRWPTACYRIFQECLHLQLHAERLVAASNLVWAGRRARVTPKEALRVPPNSAGHDTRWRVPSYYLASDVETRLRRSFGPGVSTYLRIKKKSAHQGALWKYLRCSDSVKLGLGLTAFDHIRILARGREDFNRFEHRLVGFENQFIIDTTLTHN